MARVCTIGDDPNSLGVLITACYGLDTSWMDDAECKKYRAGQRQDERNPWHVSINDDDELGVTGSRDLVKLARFICRGCKAQYGCSRYAAMGEMRGTTWGGLQIVDLKWLTDCTDETIETLCAKAEKMGIAIQDYIREIRLSGVRPY